MPSDPFIGEIFMFAGNFAPRSYALCDGQLLSISQNSALFSILGTTYGGDGRTTFGLPDLRGRFPMHPGNGPGLSPRQLGQRSGAESAQLSVLNMPSHNHGVTARAYEGEGNQTIADGATWAKSGMGDPDYQSPMTGGPTHSLAPEAIVVGNTGGSQPFSITNPFLCVNFIIALQGLFPSRS